MDYDKFSGGDFDHKAWINNFLKNIPDENVEKSVTDVVIKLQIGMEEVNTLIDDNINSAFQILPRLLREMESVKQEALVLQEQMSLVKIDIEKVEQSTQSSVYNLVKLHTQKQKLGQVETSLQDANKWTEASNNIDLLMKSDDITQICDKICILQNCLTMLKSAPDYDARQKRVDHLVNTFESILGPKLIQGFFTDDREFVKSALRLFDQIDQPHSGIKYYNAWFKPAIVQLWKDCQASSDWNENHDLLHIFYKKVIQFIEQELDRCVFPNPPEVVLNCLLDTFVELEHELDQVVSSYSADLTNPGTRLRFLASIMKVSDGFAEDLENIFKDRKITFDSKISMKLSNMIYSQLKGIDDVFLSDGVALVNQKLSLIKMDAGDVTESIEVLEESICDLFKIANELVLLCGETTHFIGIHAVFSVLRDLFMGYCKEFKRVFLNITLKLTNTSIANIPSSKGKKSNSTLDNNGNLDQYFFLQDGIRLTAVGGHLSCRFDEFLHQLSQTLVDHISRLPLSSSSCTGPCLRFYTDVLSEPGTSKRHRLFRQIQQDACCSIESMLKLEAGGNTSNGGLLDEAKQSLKFDLLKWQNEKVFACVIEPVKKIISDSGIGAIDVWWSGSETGEVMPQYAYSPQEYITKIGQFLMTLPQQVEPFLSPSAGNTKQLQNHQYYQEALLYGHLPNQYTISINWSTTSSDGMQVAHVWLESIIVGCLTALYYEWVSMRPSTEESSGSKSVKMSVHGQQQLLADIAFITSLVEDLGLLVPKELKSLQNLLEDKLEGRNLEDKNVFENSPELLKEFLQFIR